ncbi:uncharacterized protein [Littorina saxatilis]|uniref:Uncharacterized protein n=1 Tax=Littorina saxatilis TaxID=31220 RepID=A0AAN9B538_9CAEN
MSWTPRSRRNPGMMTPSYTPSDTPRMTPFEVKMMELERLKKEISRNLGRFNSVRNDYMDWFEKRRQSFVDSLKLLQITFPLLVSDNNNTMKLFREVYRCASKIPRRGMPVERCADRMKEFLDFVDRLVELKKDQDVLYDKLCAYCNSVSRIREPHQKENVDFLQKTLTQAFDENFDFDRLHNERDNLFTYRVAQHDHKFHGLLSYVPYLLKVSTNMCYWACQIYLEKE